MLFPVNYYTNKITVVLLVVPSTTQYIPYHISCNWRVLQERTTLCPLGRGSLQYINYVTTHPWRFFMLVPVNYYTNKITVVLLVVSNTTQYIPYHISCTWRVLQEGTKCCPVGCGSLQYINYVTTHPWRFFMLVPVIIIRIKFERNIRAATATMYQYTCIQYQ